DGDRLRVDLNAREVRLMVSDAEIAERRAALEAAGGYKVPESESPWQAIFRDRVRQFSDGMVLDGADKFRDIGNSTMPRHSH
ncbi:MAG: dihydroxy-acid dehydratase, partial [Rhodobacteraceae bacterium]|nr:dihydroxy-acid dehydratase [Paracoccaceae bacterium]